MQDLSRRTIDAKYRSFMGDEAVDWFIGDGHSDKELSDNINNCEVMFVNGNIAGFSILHENLIHLMMIDVDLHRIGFGSKLLHYVESLLLDKDFNKITLETFEGNAQAIKFYNNNSWNQVNKELVESAGFVRVFFEKLI